ncbi:RHS repeat-associated core domain-containing protein, partial [Azoarcus taiwanensis]
PITRTTTYTYTTVNGRSLLTEIDGPLPNGPANDPSDSDVTRFTWDAGGDRIVRITQPGERTSDIAYEAATGLVARVENREGAYTEFQYNARLQAVRLQRHGPGWGQAQTLEHRFDAFGHLVETSSSDDPTRNARLSFDAHGRLEWVANALGILETLEHDRESRLIGHRRLSASFEQSRFWHYDATGRLEATGDNRGRYVQAQYDSQGRLTALYDASGLSRRSAAASNGASNRSEPPLGVVRLLDDFGHLVWRASPDAGVQRRRFDAAGRLVAMRDAVGHHARYEYDVRGRIQRQTVTDALHADETVTTWRYEGDHLVELDHPTQRERYTYDARGLRVARVVTIPTEAGKLTAVTRYEYDAAGRLVATTLPDGSTLRYPRNGQAQVVSVTRSTIHSTWLRRFEREQTIASGFERDLVGLRGFSTGNGIETRFERSREGALARMVHRRLPEPSRRIVAEAYPTIVLGHQVFGVLERVLGIKAAHASPVENGSNGPLAGASPAPTALPGALGLPVEPGTLLDRRYLWDTRGNLLHTREPSPEPLSGASMDTHAYDARGQLVASVRWAQNGDDTASEEALWRYAYGPSQRRVLAQQGVHMQSDLTRLTTRSQFEPGTHRPIGTNDTPTRYNANGQPLELDGRTYAWDALGRLVAVDETAHTLARYGYDHRGLRNRKTIDADTHYTLHDEARQPLAELDADGRILRQYVWVADLPLAVIDTPEGVAPAAADPSALSRIAGDVRRIVQSWFGSGDTLVWLHSNHLNAPELATASHGNIIWRAHYSPFGAATVQHQGFELDLRLPGQRFDAETGLHYNRQRYYDPEHGQYLTPDPLGTPDGPNPYAYVAFSPLIYIDPDGLILFAFDGTGNDESNLNTLSNVVAFRDLYLEGTPRYITGPGTVDNCDPNRPIDPADFKPWYIPLPANTADMGGNYSGPARIDRMVEYFNTYATDVATDDSVAIDVDIIGFSRGAAQARDFANRIVANTTNGWYRYVINGQTHCQKVNLRFLGLWDTVLSTNLSGYAYNLAIPDEFAYVAQAAALNEYRGGVVAFPAESILRAPAPQGTTRIERGFLGAHSDIGGGFPDGDLAKVALVWMVDQAKAAGVNMDEPNRTIIANPVIHDKSSNLLSGAPTGGPTAWSEDRDVRYADSSVVKQRQTTDQGMTYADTVPFITYDPNPNTANNISGTVDMEGYLNWLNANGYNINMTVQ